MFKRVFISMISFYVLFIIGANFNFFPFPGNQLEWREIGYCACLVVGYIAFFAYYPKKGDTNEETDNQEN